MVSKWCPVCGEDHDPLTRYLVSRSNPSALLPRGDEFEQADILTNAQNRIQAGKKRRDTNEIAVAAAREQKLKRHDSSTNPTHVAQEVCSLLPLLLRICCVHDMNKTFHRLCNSKCTYNNNYNLKVLEEPLWNLLSVCSLLPSGHFFLLFLLFASLWTPNTPAKNRKWSLRLCVVS